MLLKWSVRDIVEVIEGCVTNKFDVIICCEGKRGTGKSTLLYKIAMRLKRRGVVKFNPETSVVYSREDTLDLIANKKRYVIFSDEMINVTYKRDFFEHGQKQIIKGLNMYRDSCNVFMMAVPLFKDLDGDMRQLTKIKLSVLRRGIAEIRVQPDFQDILESQSQKNKNKWKYKNKDLKMEPTKKVGLVVYKDITPSQREIYEEIKARKRGQVFNNEDNIQADPMADWYNKLHKQLISGNLTKDGFQAIVDMSGKKETSVRARLGMILRDNRDKFKISDYLKNAKPKINEDKDEWDKR